jgi:hypothetical protein
MTNIDTAADAALDLDPADETEIQRADARRRPGRPPRQAARDAARSSLRPGEVVGRDGEVLSRKRNQRSSDPFDIPAEIVPKGWEYQWVTVTVVGNGDIVRHQNLEFYDNGWRPVPASRHDGRFMAAGEKGAVIYGGQCLMERPVTLCNEAREEQIAKAVQQMRDRDQALMGSKADIRNKMPDGFAMGGKYRGTGADLRMSIDRALDVPAPSHELAEAGE